MNNKSIYEYLQSFGRKYNQQIKLDKKFTHFQIEFNYTIKSSIQVAPPSVSLTLDQSVYEQIHNDIEKSRRTKDGLLKSYSKGNILDQIIYTPTQEQSIGSIQESQQCLCVGYALIKDQANSFLKNMDKELMKICNQKDRYLIHLSEGGKKSQIDKLSHLINKNYRLYLIVDMKTNPDKIIIHQGCFYPHTQFSLKQMKVSNKKIAPSDPFQKMQKKLLQEDYGFLTIDSKMRFLFIEKYDPNISETPLIGMWIYGSSPRSKKQFTKEEYFWGIIMEFYTNPQVKKPVSIIGKNTGLLCFIQNNSGPINPIIYSFEIKRTDREKWTFALKSDFLTKEEQIKEIKMDFSTLAIIEEKQYSQISDNFSKNQNAHKNQNINKQNEIPIDEIAKSQIGSQINKSHRSYDQKDMEIKLLKKQLEFYKNRCQYLQSMFNPMHLQSMMFNNCMNYQNMPSPPYFQQGPNVFPNQPFPTYSETPSKSTNQASTVKSPKKQSFQEKQQEKVQYCFPEEPIEEVTFSQKEEPSPKLFLKKNFSQQKEKQTQILRNNSQTIKQIFNVNHDCRNISFQDSFAQQEDSFVEEKPQIKKVKSTEEHFSEKSPQFKKIVSFPQRNQISQEKTQKKIEIKRSIKPIQSDSSKDQQQEVIVKEKASPKQKFAHSSNQSSDSDEDETMHKLKQKYLRK